jgi:gentisate 1,2-dioxygenase
MRPQEEIRPALWRWNDMALLLLEAGALVPIDDVMKMRTLHMSNSSDPIPLDAARTFAAMLQQVNGGEITESHRHTATSIYFMIQGSGIYTTAEGEQQFMEPGDLLTQPTWTWHDSTNTGKEPAVWFTAMDTSLTQFLDVWFAEKYPEGHSQPVTKPDGYHETLGRIADQLRARWSRSVSDQVLLARYDGGSRRDRSSWRDRSL